MLIERLETVCYFRSKFDFNDDKGENVKIKRVRIGEQIEKLHVLTNYFVELYINIRGKYFE